MAGNLHEFTDENFDAEVLKSEKPVLVDFWAPWCGPCRQIGPMIEDLANEYQGSVKVGKVNIDECQGAATQFGVTSIPTLMLFEGGDVTQRVVGVRPKAHLQEMLDTAKG